jgi:pimeloyl-ACP methyl ester carboxylesterase
MIPTFIARSFAKDARPPTGSPGATGRVYNEGRDMYRDEWVTINGVRLHYQDWGCAAAPPILMLHGLTQQSHSFDGVAERLADRFRCVALDVRGRGDSDWAPPETYAIPQYIDDVARLLVALELPAVHVLGTSMGGLIGLSMAVIAPSSVRSLVLNDIGPEIDPRGVARISAYAGDVPASFPSVEAALAWALDRYAWFRAVPRPQLLEGMRWSLREGEDGQWRLKWDPAIGRSVRPDPAIMAMATRMWWGAVESMPGPMLLVRGAESDVLSPEIAAEMQRRRPGLARVDVPGIGHAPFLVEPAAVEALDRFYAPLA